LKRSKKYIISGFYDKLDNDLYSNEKILKQYILQEFKKTEMLHKQLVYMSVNLLLVRIKSVDVIRLIKKFCV